MTWRLNLVRSDRPVWDIRSTKPLSITHLRRMSTWCRLSAGLGYVFCLLRNNTLELDHQAGWFKLKCWKIYIVRQAGLTNLVDAAPPGFDVSRSVFNESPYSSPRPCTSHTSTRRLWWSNLRRSRQWRSHTCCIS
jgi:hypothetical protein